ncbi:MAG TPA: DUF488 domain-containing protein [Solirubrobacteraceae bacterium]|nr:DUF488 domain-containing protein [Solirubrobacteraceae bacterium]
MAIAGVVWTVGHSNHDIGAFLALVRRHEVVHLVDVRSHPYSRYASQFNRDELRDAVEGCGIRYEFMGTALGGRPRHEDQLDGEGRALYDRMAAEPIFGEAVEEVLRWASEGRVALLCACGQPQGCHRRLLVGKVLCERGAELRHILPDGGVTSERTVELRDDHAQEMLFGHDELPWRSTRSVSPRRPLSVSSHG